METPPTSSAATKPSVAALRMECARARLQATARALRPLGAWNGQHGHDLDGIARENGKVRMLVKELGGGLVRIREHNRESTHVIARIFDPTLRNLFGFPQRSAHADNGGVMFLDPPLPGRHAFSFPGTAIDLDRKSVV